MAEVKSEPGASAAAGPSYASASMRPVTLASTLTLPPPFGPSSAYAQTSQARNWRFSPTQLSHIRDIGNSAARKRLEALWAEENSSPSSSSISIPFLSVEDELALITYYLIKVGQIVRAFSLPELVESTATTFVKRFYLRNTCMDFHPKNIVITCIFLASKAENYPLSLKEFARKLAGKSGDAAVVEENRRTVLDLEFLVSQSLSFEYSVTGAHRSLYGLILDLQSLKEGGLGREEIHKLAADAHGNLTNSRLTDAEFVYTPSQIALACVRAVQSLNGKDIVGKWLDAKENLARQHMLEAKKRRQALREAESARAAKAKIALARRTKGKAGAKAAEDEIAASTAAASTEVLEFEDTLLENQPLGMAREELEKTLDEIEKLIRARENGGFTGKSKGPEDLERIKEIDKRQKQCMNPEKVPGSKLYKKRQVEEEGGVEGEQGGKRARKSEAGMDSDDDEVPVAKDFAVKPEPQV